MESSRVMEDTILHLWLILQRSTKKTYNCSVFVLSQLSSVYSISGVGKWIVNTFFLYNAAYVMWFTHKTILLGVLSAGTAIYLLWRRDRYTFRYFKIDVAWVSIDALSLFILTCIYDLTPIQNEHTCTCFPFHIMSIVWQNPRRNP